MCSLLVYKHGMAIEASLLLLDHLIHLLVDLTKDKTLKSSSLKLYLKNVFVSLDEVNASDVQPVDMLAPTVCLSVPHAGLCHLFEVQYILMLDWNDQIVVIPFGYSQHSVPATQCIHCRVLFSSSNCRVHWVTFHLVVPSHDLFVHNWLNVYKCSRLSWTVLPNIGSCSTQCNNQR